MRGYLTITILLGTLFLITPTVEANGEPGLDDCKISINDPYPNDDSPEKDYVAVKNVTAAGHYDDGPYKLWCQDAWYEKLGTDIAFTYVSGGHVRGPNITPSFPEDQRLGTNVQCRVSANGCRGYDENTPHEPFEVCVFNMNNPDDAHVADCNNNSVPMANSYSYSLCCEVAQACHDGKDNNLNGYVDCADPQCHTASPEPGICNFAEAPGNQTNANNQSTEECIENPENCEGPDGDYYCGYGTYDDKNIQEMGVCCPAGKSPEKDPFGNWECVRNDKCGVGTGFSCDYDINANESGYFDKVYDGDTSDFCVSEVSYLHQPSEMLTDNSAACCEVPRYGETDYWFKDDNVQVYG